MTETQRQTIMVEIEAALKTIGPFGMVTISIPVRDGNLQRLVVHSEKSRLFTGEGGA